MVAQVIHPSALKIQDGFQFLAPDAFPLSAGTLLQVLTLALQMLRGKGPRQDERIIKVLAAGVRT